MIDTSLLFAPKECQFVPGGASDVCQLPAKHRSSWRAGMDALVMQCGDCLLEELKRNQEV